MINTLFPLDFYIQSKISNIDEICDVADKLAEYRTQNNKWGNGCTVETVSMDKVDWHPLLECAMSKFNEEIKWVTIYELIVPG